MSDDTLSRLAEAIASTTPESADNSYTRQLLDGGPERCAKKLGEEAFETAIAGVSQSNEALRKGSGGPHLSFAGIARSARRAVFRRTG